MEATAPQIKSDQTQSVAVLGNVISRMPVRGLVLIAAVALAYNYSLETLVRGLGYQTPLAYLSLVPLIALSLGAVNFRVHPTLLAIHDRQFDWIIGLFLILIAASIDLLLPSAYNADFWVHRVDMIGLPFFTAGLVSLLYGTRRLWSMRWAIMFLFLAWPDPYVTVLAAAIGTSTDMALAAVQASLQVIPVAQPLGNGTFLVTHGSDQFSLAVGSACSGINSLVGFLMLGAAFNTIFSGGLLRRILWLATGLILVGALNVLRIDLIFVAGWAFGEPFAIDILHPVAGVFVFGMGALAMVWIARFFGLRIPTPPARTPAPNSSRPISDPPSTRHPAHHIRVAAPMAVGLLIAGMLAFPDASFAHYDSLVDAFGSPTLGAIDPSGLSIPGWDASPSTSFDQATNYFGASATWERVAFSQSGSVADSTTIGPSTSGTPAGGPGVTDSPSPDPSADPSADPSPSDATPVATSPTDTTTSVSTASAGATTVYLDVIRTDDSGSLAAYGVEACYNFHGFDQVLSGSVDIGAGVDAKVASFRSPISGSDWSILWWEWPFNAGGDTRYERIVLLAPLDPADQAGGKTSEADFQSADSTIEGLARSIVGANMSDPAQTPAPGALP